MSIEIDCTIGVVVSWIVAIDPTGVRFPDGAKLRYLFFFALPIDGNDSQWIYKVILEL